METACFQPFPCLSDTRGGRSFMPAARPPAPLTRGGGACYNLGQKTGKEGARMFWKFPNVQLRKGTVFAFKGDSAPFLKAETVF